MRTRIKIGLLVAAWMTLFVIIFGLLAAHDANAMGGKFSWLPNQESDLAGYKIHYGTASGQYDQIVDCGLPETVDGRVTYTVPNIPDTLTYFAATAYDSQGHESAYSNEISYDPVPSAPQDFKTITINVTVNVSGVPQ